MATPGMKKRENRREKTEHFIKGCHLKLENLRVTARDVDKRYLPKTNQTLPDYPRPEFYVSRLKHDTDRAGLEGIKDKGGFMNSFRNGSLLYFSLFVGPEDIEAAEERLLETTYPDRTEEQVQSQQSFLERFASSPAFLRSSRYGSYRFTFSVKEVLEAYKAQFCPNDEPIMKVMETVLHRQEVVYVVLVHSTANEEQFSEYPRLADNPDSICTYKDNCFMWRSEAMCKTHSYKLFRNDAEKKMEAVWAGYYPEYYVWDHVVIALHVDDQVLEFDVNQLREKLTFCEEAEVALADFEEFQEAERVVADLWPGHPSPLMRDGERALENPQEDQRLAEAEDNLPEALAKFKL